MPGRIKRVIISIAGGHATGSVQLAINIKESLAKIFTSTKISVIDLDKMVKKENRNYTNSDYDFTKLYEDLTTISNGTVSQDRDVKSENPLEIILLCGCYALYDEQLRSLCKLKVFIDSDGDKRLIKLIQSIGIENPEELSLLISEYMDHLRIEMQNFIQPTRAFADLVIPCTNDNIGSAILLDGIVKVVQEMKGNDPNEAGVLYPKKSALLSFEAERMDLQKGRYYDLS